MSTCDEIIDTEINLYEEDTKTVKTNFNEKNGNCKTKKFYILLAFLLITTSLQIVISIYCYVIKYRAKLQVKISSKNILVYNISKKTLVDGKSLRIRFDKTDRFIRVYGGTRYLVLFKNEKYDFIYNKIGYLI